MSEVELRDLSGQSLPFTYDLHNYTEEAKLLFDNDSEYSVDYNPVEEAIGLLLEPSSGYGMGDTVAEVITEDAEELVNLYKSLRIPAKAAMVVDNYDVDPVQRDWIQDTLDQLAKITLDLEQEYYPG